MIFVQLREAGAKVEDGRGPGENPTYELSINRPGSFRGREGSLVYRSSSAENGAEH